MSSKLWGGRFSQATHGAVEQLNRSLPFDRRMAAQDIKASLAHAEMLGETGVLSSEESGRIVQELQVIADGLQNNRIELDPKAEDIHSAVEALLRDRIGALAGKLHTGRSRNDQVVTDLRLYLRDAIDDLLPAIERLERVFMQRAEENQSVILPGYTHLQHAQPILLAHHLLAYFWMLERDRRRFQQVRKSVNELPLGAAALAGSSFPLDRKRVAERLGFDSVIPNSLDAVSDRDFAVEFTAAAALLLIHLSRFAEELILWSSAEFGFVELSEAVTTGSSMMPQKKNPDVAELARGKCGRVAGDLVNLLSVLKGLPLAYNKDLQEDKEAVFDAVDTLAMLLPAYAEMVATVRFNPERMRAATQGDFSTATELADYLVRKGIPFREAHHLVGQVVRHCLDRGHGLETIPLVDLQNISPKFDEDAVACLGVEAAVSSKTTEGGTALSAVQQQILLARQYLET